MDLPHIACVKMEHQLKIMHRKWNSRINNCNEAKMQKLYSKEYGQSEISQTLQVGLATVNREISYLRNQAEDNIKGYIDERLPEEYQKCMAGLTSIVKEAWNNATNTEDRREKIQALSLASAME